VIFAAKIVSVLTGPIFQFIVARSRALGLLMAIDKEVRRLPRDIIAEFKQKQATTES
jgi:hypothetical protein